MNTDNIQVSTFGKGMNTDLSYSMLQDGQYSLAKNLRITALNQSGQGDITNGQGILRPIEGLNPQLLSIRPKRILATNSIRHIGIIVYVDEDDYWKVAVFKNKIGTGNDVISSDVHVIYNSEQTTDANKFSTVVHYESFNLVKLYIADGVNPIKALNIVTSGVQEGEELGEIPEGLIDQGSVDQYPNIIFRPLKFRGLTSGSLKAGMIQYTYRLYIKYGVSTDMSPATNLIPIVYPNTLLGEEPEANVNAGVILNLTIDQEYRDVFTHIQIWRIFYSQNDADPKIELFKDEEISEVLANGGEIIDTGELALQDMTVEEFNNITGLHIIPKILESKNDILFAAATTDVQTAEFEDIDDDSITNDPLDYEFVQLDLIGDAQPASGGVIRHNTNKRTVDDSTWNLGSAIAGTELESDIRASVKNNNYMYSDPGISYYARSLRRGETYRYGIVYYNIKGESSGVTHVTDVYVGEKNGDDHGLSNLKNTFTFDSDSKYELEVHPIGVKFKNIPMPAGAYAYEIVRCRRQFSDMHNISQGVIARPVTKYVYDHSASTMNKSDIHTPTGFLTMQDFFFGDDCVRDRRSATNRPFYRSPADRPSTNEYELESQFHADNYDNKTILQFVSPEVCYSKDFSNLLNKNNSQAVALHIVDNLYCKTGIREKQYGLLDLYNDSIINYGRTDADLKIYQFPCALHNANLLEYPYDESDGVSYKPGVCYRKHPMIFYSAKPGDFIKKAGNDYEGNFTYVNPSADEVTDGTQIKDSVVTRLTGENHLVILKVKPYSYAPIKLYNRATNVHDDSVDPMEDIEISSYVMSDDLSWNQDLDADKQAKEINPDESITNSYMQHETVIGKDKFCNVVIGGFYNEPLGGEGNFINPTDNAFEGSTDDIFFMANGGPCAVLELKKNIRIMRATSSHWDELMYTHLCNITQDSIPYGGESDAAKRTSAYFSHGQYSILTEDQLQNKVVNQQIVFDGDTYIQPLEYVSMYKMAYASAYDSVASNMVLYSIPVETSINLTYTHGFEFSREYQGKEYITNIQKEPESVYINKDASFNQDEPMYAYNMAYSSESSTKPNNVRTEKLDAETFKYTDYRIFYSNVKENGENIDSWLKFDTLSFLDVDTKYGPITHLRNFHNKLMFWQERAMGVLSVNERAVLSVSENTAENKPSKLPLVLGTGGVLERYDYLDDTSGMAPEQYCDAMSSSTLYWYDDNNNEIKAYTDGQSIRSLSKFGGVQNIMHQYDDDNLPWLFYDHKYNEAVLDLKETPKTSIVYNEQINSFTSLYDVGFDGTIQFKNGLYLLNLSDAGLQIGEWNKSDVPNGFDGPLNTFIQYVVNKTPLTTKVFDNQEIVSIYGGETTDQDSYFTEDHKYRWKTDLMDTGEIDNLQMTLREGNYRYAIPREGNAEYGSRMRGKYMICDIEDISPKKDASLTSIITKFRTSWS